MTPAVAGGLLGAAAGLGLVLVTWRVAVIRRPRLAPRVLPYLRDVPRLDSVWGPGGPPAAAQPAPVAAAAGVFGPPLRAAAHGIERVLGGGTSVRRRLHRADLAIDEQEFRVQQVLWGLAAMVPVALYAVLEALSDPGGALGTLLLCLVAFAGGVLARDSRLTSQVRTRERRILAEFPAVAELLALAVAAGEGPVAALDRVVRRSDGALSSDLARVLAEVRTGEPVGAAFDGLAATSGLPLVSRFAQAVAVAVERGTPLADVLHAQAADVREAGRRELIETAARREVLMMVPVVFLVLPVTVLFAFWPGWVGLSLATPDLHPVRERTPHASIDLLADRAGHPPLARPGRRGAAPRRARRRARLGADHGDDRRPGGRAVEVRRAAPGEHAEPGALDRVVRRPRRRCAGAARARTERGAAVVDAVLVLVVLVPLFLGILQLGLVLHVRNTLTSAASEGARTAAELDRGMADGEARTRREIAGAVSGRFARGVDARPVDLGGVAAVEVVVRADVPPLGLFGPGVPLRVTGHAVREEAP